MDGIWKPRSPHCMWPVTTTVEELPLLNYPNVCTNEPINQNNAFCLYHFEEAKKHNVPSNLRDFLRLNALKLSEDLSANYKSHFIAQIQVRTCTEVKID